MRLWTCTAREARRRPGRTLLTLLGISLGLATVVATRLTIHAAHRAYGELFADEAGGTALEITAAGLGGFDGSFAPELAGIPGVREVIVRIQGAAAIQGKDRRLSAPVLGIDPACAAALAGWSIAEGESLGDPDDALLDTELAQGLGLRPGDRVDLWAPAGPARLRLAGTLRPLGASAPLGGVLVVPLAAAQRLFALPGHVNSIQVLLAEDAEPDRVQAEVSRRLPAGLAVRPPGARGAMARATLLSTEQGLSCLSALALVGAAFVILNTFLLNLGERRRQLAILRTLGATRAQVCRLLLREMLLLGLAGTLAGCLGGLALAHVLLRAMEGLLGVHLPGLQLSAGPFLLAGGLGPCTALAAAWLPAWSASRREPLEELLPQRGGPCRRPPCWLGLAGLLALALGATLELGLCRQWFAARVGQVLLAPALALLLAGCVLALPVLMAPILRLAGAVPLGLQASLARQQLERCCTRTGLTAGVLFLSLAVAIGFGQTLRGLARDLRRWCRQTIVADYLVRGSMPDTAFTLAAALPESLADELGRAEGVAAVDRLSFLPATANGRPVLVLARTFPPAGPLPLDLQEGEADAVRAGLARGEVVLGTGLAGQLGLGRGDVLTLATDHGPQRLRVAGTVTEYAVGGMALYLQWDAARRLLDVPGVHVFLVSAGPAGAEAAAPALRTFCERHGLMLQSNAELRGVIEQMLARVTGVLWALMALSFVVASLGVVNTLTMNVREQARALGVLRALGLKRRQVCRVVLTQALLLGGVSLGPGALAGVGLAYVINRSSTSWVGPPVTFEIDAPVVGVGIALALGIAFVAALLPARRAARLPVIGALLSG
jgi:putative ABC transport system permease protein